MDAVLADPRTAPISEKEKALLAYVERVNGHNFELRRDEVEALKQAGWTDEAIYDAVTVCSLFNFYNRWCDGTGVHPMAPELHAMGGKRMAKFGYLPPAE